MSLRIRKLKEEPGEPMPGEGHMGVNSVMVVDETEVSSFSCRVLRIEPDGSTAIHSHSRTHVVIALIGSARVETDLEATQLGPEEVVTIPGYTPHRFVNVAEVRAVLLVQNLFPLEKADTTH